MKQIIYATFIAFSFKNQDDKAMFFKALYTKKWNKTVQCTNWWQQFLFLFDEPIKNKEETYEKIIEMSKNSDYTAGKLLN